MPRSRRLGTTHAVPVPGQSAPASVHMGAAFGRGFGPCVETCVLASLRPLRRPLLLSRLDAALDARFDIGTGFGPPARGVVLRVSAGIPAPRVSSEASLGAVASMPWSQRLLHDGGFEELQDWQIATSARPARAVTVIRRDAVSCSRVRVVRPRDNFIRACGHMQVQEFELCVHTACESGGCRCRSSAGRRSTSRRTWCTGY